MNQLGLQEQLAGVGFTEFKLRDRGRYDMVVPSLASPAFDFLHGERAPWLPQVCQVSYDVI